MAVPQHEWYVVAFGTQSQEWEPKYDQKEGTHRETQRNTEREGETRQDAEEA